MLSKRTIIVLFAVSAWANQVFAFVDRFVAPSPYVFTRQQKTGFPVFSFWSQSAEIVTGSEDAQGIRIKPSSTSRMFNASRAYDLSSPREWMEYLEETSLDSNNEIPRGGAYTVIRCDYTISDSGSGNWKIWGEKFHLKRLCSSYLTLIRKERQINAGDLDKASVTSKKVLRYLLEEAESALKRRKVNAEVGSSVVVMVTLLWERGTTPADVVIRGHACTSGAATVFRQHMPNPVTVCVAMASKEMSSLPDRLGHSPEAKLSSWCRRRRPLEENYKPKKVDEVLLVHKPEDNGNLGNVEILEGLTSNFFVLYDDGTLRTAKEGVLEGFARKLVVESANQCGIMVEFGSITLAESNRWIGAFLTSSIKLITPIRAILVPKSEEGETQFKTLWSYESTHQDAVWNKLYKCVLTERKDTKL